MTKDSFSGILMDAECGTRGESIARVVALGASNLTRGLHALVSAARDRWGRDIEIFAALGNGRSYGAPSRIFFRALPGILQSGLWLRLENLAPAPAVGLIADVGNDILYGTSVPQILEWVEVCARRLRRVARDVVLTDLPLGTVRRRSGRCGASRAAGSSCFERSGSRAAASPGTRCWRQPSS